MKNIHIVNTAQTLMNMYTSNNTNAVYTFHTEINSDDLVIAVRLKDTYFVEGREERQYHIRATANSKQPFQMCHYFDMWGDCWCTMPESVSQLWRLYMHMRRFTLPAAVFARKEANNKLEEEHETHIRNTIAKRFKFDPVAFVFYKTENIERDQKKKNIQDRQNEFNQIKKKELQIRDECAHVLATHVALMGEHEALHGTRFYGAVELLFPLTILERRLKAYSRNDVTRGVVDMDLNPELSYL